MTEHELARYGIGALALVLMAVCGYVLDAIRTPEDWVSRLISWACLLVGGFGLAALVFRLLFIGLTL